MPSKDDAMRKGTVPAHARKVMGDHQRFKEVDRAAKDRKQRTQMRQASRVDSKSGRPGEGEPMSTRTLALAVFGGLLCFSAFLYWTVVIAWAP